MNESEIREIVQKTISAVRSGKSSGKAVTLANAERLCDAVIREAERMGVKAVVCVADAGGHPRIMKSMDGAYLASYDVAVNKAYTVVALKMSTMTLKPLAQPGASLYGIQFTNGGKIVIFGGGDPLHNGAGEIVGGLGVSGGSEEEDAALSAYGRRFFENEMK